MCVGKADTAYSQDWIQDDPSDPKRQAKVTVLQVFLASFSGRSSIQGSKALGRNWVPLNGNLSPVFSIAEVQHDIAQNQNGTCLVQLLRYKPLPKE